MQPEEEVIGTFLQVALALNKAVGEVKGIEPLLSTATYTYPVPTPSWGWEEIGRQAEEVEAGLDSLSPRRREYVRDLLRAFRMMVREGLGEDIPYAERVATYLQVPGERVPQATVQALEDELRALLAEAGYGDDLSVAIPQWRGRQTVQGQALMDLARAFLERARQETERRIMPLPPGHQVVLSFPQNYPYRGYSDYARDYQGRVFLNGDIGWEVPSLKHVLCHEAFPGHQTYSALREWCYREGRLPVEATLYFSNTPITPIVEGMAEIGQEVLGLVETLDDRIYDVYNRFCSAVSTNLAFDCNADGMDKETAVARLMETTYVSRVFAEKRYHFWTDPLWCTGFPHYWYGREWMRECYARMKAAGRLREFFRMVYTEPHTVRSLREAVQFSLAEGE